MNVVLIGATGNIGSRILAELVRRGHSVTAISRNIEKVPAVKGVTPKRGDVSDAAGLAALIKGHDVAISAVHFSGGDPRALIGAVKTAGVKRYLVVGGAGSLEVAPGTRLIDTPQFPAEYKEEASKGADFLGILRGETELDWTFLSPSALILPGERTGRFRLGADSLLVDASGQSHISMEDYAVAMVDEVEKPAHSRRRFTVGY